MLRLFMVFFLLAGLSSCPAAYRLTNTDVAKLNLQEKEFFVELDGQPPIRLADIYEAHQGLVLIFWQSQCPCVKRYQKRINNLFEKYGEQGLAFLFVSSNTNEKFSEAINEYKKRNSPLALARDEQGKLAQALQVKGTPTAVLLDKQGQVKFMGWIDNEQDEPEKGRIAYLENAIKEYLANKPVSVATSPMFGCPIND